MGDEENVTQEVTKSSGMQITKLSNGVEIAYECFGDKDNSPLGTIFLIMGLGGQLIHWPDELCQTLVKEGLHVVRFDNRDVGESSKFTDWGVPSVLYNFVKKTMGFGVSHPYLLADMAEDTALLMDHLQVEAAHVAGVSMGGMITQEVAIKFPHKVKSMCSIMSSTGDPTLPAAAFSVSWALAKSPGPTVEERMEHSVNIINVIGSPKFKDEERIRTLSRLANERCPDRSGVARQLMAILASPDRTPHLKSVSCPALVIHGKVDPLVLPSHGEATHKAIPNSELVLIDDMGHDLPVPLAETLAQHILSNVKKAQ